MNLDPQLEEAMREWLAGGSEQLPDRYLEAALDEVAATPQRRGRLLVRWFSGLGSGARIASAAAVAAVVFLLGVALASQRNVGPTPSPSPTPAVSSPVPTVSPTFQGGSGLALDESGRLFASDCDLHTVWRFDEGLPVLVVGIPRQGLSRGFAGDGGPALEAVLECPGGLAFDGTDLLVADLANNRIRKVSAGGIIHTIAGSGPSGPTAGGYSGDGGPATVARLNFPGSMAFDAMGSLYFTEERNNVVRRIDPDGTVTTYAGDGTRGYGGDAGPATAASLAGPKGIAIDAEGNVYVADQGNHRVRMIDPNGIITTFAGTGESASRGDGGPATEASIASPNDLALDRVGNLYITDVGGFRIRRVDTNGVITTFAGTGIRGNSGDGAPAVEAELGTMQDGSGMVFDAAGTMYFADSGNGCIRVIHPDGLLASLWCADR